MYFYMCNNIKDVIRKLSREIVRLYVWVHVGSCAYKAFKVRENIKQLTELYILYHETQQPEAEMSNYRAASSHSAQHNTD